LRGGRGCVILKSYLIYYYTLKYKFTHPLPPLKRGIGYSRHYSVSTPAIKDSNPPKCEPSYFLRVTKVYSLNTKVSGHLFSGDFRT
jgi:hypothetical protein